MTEILAVKGWATTFETAHSRNHKVLTWVSLPVALDSAGYDRLLDSFEPDDAPRIYGAWCALIQVAARAPTRGVLKDSDGNPFTTRRIARLTGFPVDTIAEMMEWSQRVGWLEPYAETEAPESPEDSAEEPTTNRQGIVEESSRNREGTDEDSSSPLPNPTQPNQTKDKTTSGRVTADRPPDRKPSSSPSKRNRKIDPSTGRPMDSPESRFLAEWDRVLGGTRWRRRFTNSLMPEAMRSRFLELCQVYGEVALIGIPSRIKANDYLMTAAKQCTIAWVFQRDGGVALLEGTYDRERPNPSESSVRIINP